VTHDRPKTTATDGTGGDADHSAPVDAVTTWTHPTGGYPRRINIVGCGPTQQTFHAAHQTYDVAIIRADETWTLNKALRTVRSHLVFIMDDLIGEATRSEQYRNDIRSDDRPIITSSVDAVVKEQYPHVDLHAYPILDVLNHCAIRALGNGGMPFEEMLDKPKIVGKVGRMIAGYMHNSLPYMLAYALFVNVHEVTLFGVDYSIEGSHIREDDRANCEYWIGFLRACGMKITVTDNTTLLNTTRQPWWYGYGARPPKLRDPTRLELEAEMERIGKITVA